MSIKHRVIVAVTKVRHVDIGLVQGPEVVGPNVVPIPRVAEFVQIAGRNLVANPRPIHLAADAGQCIGVAHLIEGQISRAHPLAGARIGGKEVLGRTDPAGKLDIATNIKTNIRELEGSLNKLIALYKLNSYQDPIDINLATRALKDIISSKNNRVVTPELILDIVADHFNISVADLKSNKRNAEIAIPRQIAMYFIRSMTDTSLKSIGVILGGKDHSTIKYGADKIAIEIKEDETLANTINIIKKKINPA